MPETPGGTRRFSATLLWGIGLLLAAALPPLAAPWLAPYDPGEINSAPAQNRAPGTVLAVVRLADGSTRIADRAERVPEGLRLLIGERSETLPAAAVTNLTSTGVADHRRFLLGTDHLGRDLWSRLLYGGRISLLIGTVSVLLALTLGITIGSTAALGGRLLDSVLMRLVDVFLAFPWIFLIIALVALFSAGLGPLVLILGGTGWMEISRLLRAEIKGLKQREFVLAARALGQHPLRIFWRHLLPNALTPVLIRAAILVGNVILAESSLSFLGFGVQPPTPSWGNMVAEGRSPSALFSTWWVAVFPGAAIALTVIALNLLSDGLRDALDPSHRGRRPADATLPPL